MTAEASARVLLDRTMIRVDGRPYFAFGIRLFLTPAHDIPAVMLTIKSAGFNTVSTPPASLGNLAVLDSIFDSADELGLMVILVSDERVKNPSQFLADQFKHRKSLHSYCITTSSGDEKEFIRFCRERDKLRIQDVFHPIWTPYREEFSQRLYLDSTDLHAITHTVGGPLERLPSEDGAEKILTLYKECRDSKLNGRPFFCHSLSCMVPDRVRSTGLYDFDSNVTSHSLKSNDWYPYYTDIDQDSRWDFLPPDSDLLRLRCFEMMSLRVRGILSGVFDFLQGRSPFTGQDRFHELSIIAREVDAIKDFLAEGQFVYGGLETGHPNLKASMLHHTDDILVMIWRIGVGDDSWLDPIPMKRAEIYLDISAPDDLKAYSLNFPQVTPLPIRLDAKGAVMIELENFDLTGKILLTRSKTRPQDIAHSVETSLPEAVTSKLKVIEVRTSKIHLIESELGTQQSGLGQKAALDELQSSIREAKNLIRIEEYDSAWKILTDCSFQQREMINKQMVRAWGKTVRTTNLSMLELYRRSYYTLPQFYKELHQRDEEIIDDYT